MKKITIITICLLVFASTVIGQNNSTKKYEIEELINCQSIRIGGRSMKVGDTFNETERIDWADKKQAIKVREVGSTGKGVNTLNRKNMNGKINIKEYFLRINNGISRSAGSMEYATSTGFPQKRIALVVGNSNYINDHSLANPVLDACYVCEALQDKGFDVILELDGNKSKLDSDLDWFLEVAEKNGENGVALFYYAGHGIQIDKVDYIIPSDANQRNRPSDLKKECVEINDIVDRLQSQSRLQNLIIIDACRNQKGRGGEFDFQAPRTDDGTSLLYSTKSGDIADDGKGKHSAFAEAFVNQIQPEGRNWDIIDDEILDEVKSKNGQSGLPFGKADRRFIFNPSNSITALATPLVKKEEPTSKEIAISSISLNKTSLTLEIGGTSSLSVTYMPTNATDKSTTWKSTDNRVVKVSNTGVVTAVTSGSAAIIASCGGKDAFCNITVKEKTNPIQQQQENSSSNGNIHNGHEWVDLGLSVLWATCNVGASKPEGYGDLYAWGETSTKTENQWSTYIYSNDDYGKLTKYCSDRSKGYNGYTDRKTMLELSDDVASKKWGGSWRMPTITEINELLNNCIWTYTTINGINGCKIISKKPGYTDNFIFLPAAGFRNGTSATYIGTYGEYWSSSLSADFSDYACGIHFIYNQIIEKGNNGIDLRLVGRSVRPVLNKESAKDSGSTSDSSEASDKQNTLVESYTTDKDNNHEYVDLGLSVLWATCNVGASKPEDCGNYYAWGETSPKANYTMENYIFRTRGDWFDNVKFSKYNTNKKHGKIDNNTTLDPQDDVSSQKWGGNWRMPTDSEFDELIAYCTWTWTTQNGINGYKITSKKTGYTDRSIFLPAAGFYSSTGPHGVGSRGNYWTSTLSTLGDETYRAKALDIFDNWEGKMSYITSSEMRWTGYTVRPVKESDKDVYSISYNNSDEINKKNKS